MGILEILRIVNERKYEDGDILIVDVYTVNPNVMYRKVQVKAISNDGIAVDNDNGGVAHLPLCNIASIEIYD